MQDGIIEQAEEKVLDTGAGGLSTKKEAQAALRTRQRGLRDALDDGSPCFEYCCRRPSPPPSPAPSPPPPCLCSGDFPYCWLASSSEPSADNSCYAWIGSKTSGPVCAGVCTGDDPLAVLLRFLPAPAPAQEGLSHVLRWGLVLAGIVVGLGCLLQVGCARPVRDARVAGPLIASHKARLNAAAPSDANQLPSPPHDAAAPADISMPPPPPHPRPRSGGAQARAGRRATTCEALRRMLGRDEQNSQWGRLLLV